MIDSIGMLRTKVRLWLPVGMAFLAFAALAGEAQGQGTDALPSAPVPQVSGVKFAGGVEVQQATAGPLPLSLDDAIARGVKSNLVMELSRQNERAVKGQVLTVGNYLLPDMTASGRMGRSNAGSRARDRRTLRSVANPLRACAFGTAVRPP